VNHVLAQSVAGGRANRDAGCRDGLDIRHRRASATFHIPYTAASSWQRRSHRRELAFHSNNFGTGQPVMQKKSVTIEEGPQNSATKEKKANN